MTKLTVGALGAESTHKVLANGLEAVEQSTAITMAAESSVIPWAELGTILCFNVLEHALTIVTFPVLGEEEALWHTVLTKLVEKLARFALFTQSPKPVLTNDSTIIADMGIFTVVSLVALSLLEVVADLLSAVESELLSFRKEGI